MTRRQTNILKQAIEGITVSGGGGGNQSELLSTHSDGSTTSFIGFDATPKIFALNLASQVGADMVVTVADGTQDLMAFRLEPSFTENITFSPGFIEINTNVTFKKDISGTLRYSIVYQ